MHTLEILHFMKKNSPIVAAEKKVFILRNEVRKFRRKKTTDFFIENVLICYVLIFKSQKLVRILWIKLPYAIDTKHVPRRSGGSMKGQASLVFLSFILGYWLHLCRFESLILSNGPSTSGFSSILDFIGNLTLYRRDDTANRWIKKGFTKCWIRCLRFFIKLIIWTTVFSSLS